MHLSDDPTLIAGILIVSAIYFSLSMIVALNLKLHWTLRYLFGFTVLPLFFFLIFMTVKLWETVLPRTLSFFQNLTSNSLIGSSLVEFFLFIVVAIFGVFLYYRILKYLNKYLPQAIHQKPSLISYIGINSSDAEIFIIRKRGGTRFSYDVTINNSKIAEMKNNEYVHFIIREGKYILGVTSVGGWSGFSRKNESCEVILEPGKIYYFIIPPIFPYAKIESTTKATANKLLLKSKSAAMQETILHSIQPLKDI